MLQWDVRRGRLGDAWLGMTRADAAGVGGVGAVDVTVGDDGTAVRLSADAEPGVLLDGVALFHVPYADAAAALVAANGGERWSCSDTDAYAFDGLCAEVFRDWQADWDDDADRAEDEPGRFIGLTVYARRADYEASRRLTAHAVRDRARWPRPHSPRTAVMAADVCGEHFAA